MLSSCVASLNWGREWKVLAVAEQGKVIVRALSEFADAAFKKFVDAEIKKAGITTSYKWEISKGGYVFNTPQESYGFTLKFEGYTGNAIEFLSAGKSPTPYRWEDLVYGRPMQNMEPPHVAINFSERKKNKKQTK